MRQDKERIFQLRKEGYTYREIQRDTGVSRATLSAWFKDQQWSKHLAVGHIERNTGLSKDRMERMNMVRKLKLQYQYALVEKEAERDYQLFKKEPLFWAGLMLYAGEGDKRSKGQVRISNADFYVHRIFMQFEEKYLGVSKETVRCALLLYPDLDETICKNAWGQALLLDQRQFHKTQVLQGREAVKRLQFGIGITIISSTALKRRILKWLQLAQAETQF